MGNEKRGNRVKISGIINIGKQNSNDWHDLSYDISQFLKHLSKNCGDEMCGDIYLNMLTFNDYSNIEYWPLQRHSCHAELKTWWKSSLKVDSGDKQLILNNHANTFSKHKTDESIRNSIYISNKYKWLQDDVKIWLTISLEFLGPLFVPLQIGFKGRDFKVTTTCDFKQSKALLLLKLSLERKKKPAIKMME